MPVKSRAQFRLMKMMEHNPESAKDGPDISPEKAKEMTEGNIGKKAYKKLPEFKKLKKALKKE